VTHFEHCVTFCHVVSMLDKALTVIVNEEAYEMHDKLQFTHFTDMAHVKI